MEQLIDAHIPPALDYQIAQQAPGFPGPVIAVAHGLFIHCDGETAEHPDMDNRLIS